MWRASPYSIGHPRLDRYLLGGSALTMSRRPLGQVVARAAAQPHPFGVLRAVTPNHGAWSELQFAAMHQSACDPNRTPPPRPEDAKYADNVGLLERALVGG